MTYMYAGDEFLAADDDAFGPFDEGPATGYYDEQDAYDDEWPPLGGPGFDDDGYGS